MSGKTYKKKNRVSISDKPKIKVFARDFHPIEKATLWAGPKDHSNATGEAFEERIYERSNGMFLSDAQKRAKIEEIRSEDKKKREKAKETRQKQITKANDDLETRRRFIESVVSSASKNYPHLSEADDGIVRARRMPRFSVMTRVGSEPVFSFSEVDDGTIRVRRMPTITTASARPVTNYMSRRERRGGKKNRKRTVKQRK